MDKDRAAHILDSDRIQWSDSDHSRLDYKMIFEEHNGELSGSKRREEEVERLREREREWEDRLEKIRTESYQLGLREGRKQGVAEEKKRLQPALEEIRQGASEAEEASIERWRVLEDQLVDLSFALAEKVIDEHVQNPDFRKRMNISLDRMVNQLQDRTGPVLVVHPEDLEPIADLVKETGLMDLLRLETDEDYRRGEYRVETRKEVLVATYRELLDELKQSLTTGR